MTTRAMYQRRGRPYGKRPKACAVGDLTYITPWQWHAQFIWQRDTTIRGERGLWVRR